MSPVRPGSAAGVALGGIRGRCLARAGRWRDGSRIPEEVYVRPLETEDYDPFAVLLVVHVKTVSDRQRCWPAAPRSPVLPIRLRVCWECAAAVAEQCADRPLLPQSLLPGS